MQSKKWKILNFGTFVGKLFKWMNNSLCIVKKSLDDVLNFTLKPFNGFVKTGLQWHTWKNVIKVINDDTESPGLILFKGRDDDISEDFGKEV